MFRKIMIALLMLLQIAVPVGMATYRPADEDVIREKGTRYELLLQDNFSYRTSGTVFVSSALLSAVDIYQTPGRYAVISTDADGFASIDAFTEKKPAGDAYLLRSEADRLGAYYPFTLDVPPGFADAAKKAFRQTYYYSYDNSFTEYDYERNADSPTLAVELYVYRGHAALGELLIDGRTAEEYLAALQGGNS